MKLTKLQRMNVYRFEYSLLSRLKDECEAYIGKTGDEEEDRWDCRYRNTHNIGADNIEEQVNKMKELWNRFPDDLKPEWCSWTDIEDLEYKVKNIK